MAQKYAHPPVIEAIVEFRLENPLSSEQLDALSEKYADRLPIKETVSTISVTVDADFAESQKTNTGYRMRQEDGGESVTINDHVLTNSLTGIYSNWDDFMEFVSWSWTNWSGAINENPIARLGVRFINRIDLKNTGQFKIEDYLTIYPMISNDPEQILYDYKMQLAIPSNLENSYVIVNTGMIKPPTGTGSSFILDIDVFRTEKCPQKHFEIFAYLENIHNEKNELFESFITDKTREIFQ